MSVVKQIIMESRTDENDSHSDKNSNLEEDHWRESIYQQCMVEMEKNWRVEQGHILIKRAEVDERPMDSVQEDGEHH